MLIRLKTQIDYSLFGTSDRVLVGRDGWLFYRSTVNVEVPLVESMLTDEEQARIATGMRLFIGALEKAGIHSVLVINMMSDRFYTDKLPNAAVRRLPHPRMDDLIVKLREIPSVHYVDSFAILRKAMTQRTIFHKTDFHWNDPAAFDVAKAVVDDMSVTQGLPRSAWNHPLEIALMPSSGGIANFMPLFVPPSEMALMVKPTYTFLPGTTTGYNVGVFESVTNSAPGTPGYLAPAVFIGDSFLDGMIRAGLQTSFTSTARARWSPAVTLSKVAQDMPADTRFCLIEFIEVGLTALRAFADLDDVAKAVVIIEHRATK
ncbi:alginate O-acetyltransferase AlgX-related protein [Tardiphaga sp. vice278]|uniref:alginate O-acetyltransferase AlgX-related protein n=1 Tax=Tardiphaga sp. vice278 TaxID=2592815 RepID=UPI00143CD330|nr:hypothetical protein [Tardiphaga sp. vice278]